MARHKAALGPSYRHFSAKPLHLLRASGVRMWDAKRGEHLDFYYNAPSGAHRHPRFVAAMAAQAAE